MRLVVQRVRQASVSVSQATIGQIGAGCLVLIGIHRQDRPEQTTRLSRKLADLRIFEDADGKMNHSLLETRKELLLVSQFTLYGNCMNGRRPDFFEAAPASHALPIYEKFSKEIKEILGTIQEGKFGAQMEVSLINDGPVTLILEG
ncbi:MULTISPECIES: D-aminoacyl-tRNA deacylase [Parachlamydia]|jgi:D-tyrosyl-tRNA(Tyr) deacylase|uniref:D-aminoacyl-tRNA deacylase n=2 Tax=Parachlamydia acanthamoebae TaxID=83552 RepID=F8KXT8_PARAV|nr:D-aminoacyl-tRNA deacylase [Parachlamydia acanthamoebae]EFB40448.1 hypothetical protein pah_c205o102 [Parachlamydia acanthamoebae str. Hall's coccus]KIA78586.1 D-tyrosyl-tRNA(Tyr) deacylase [Parachlamydia acanthamoebae]CCB85668.1 D-tyrosyl-tRNA(Tyr) deacylase [Parachlamydia acanthamoebae UV-7]